MTDFARIGCDAAVTPRNPPRMTIAVLMYHSGRTASFSHPAKPGKKLPMTRPAASATMNPPSLVSLSDQLIPNLCMSAGVVTAKFA